MSVEATGWAFRQKVPAKPKIVLLALADQADETSGRVCYGKTDMKHLAAKSSCGERSLYRYIGALVRNGYIIRESGKEKGQASGYWLCMDRPAAKSVKEFQWKADEEPEVADDEAPDDEAPQDVADGSAKLADPPAPEIVESDDQNGRGGLPHGGRASVPEDINILHSGQRGARSTSFSKKAQDAEIENRSISRTAAKAGAQAFVIEGSRAWSDWLAYRRNVLRMSVWGMPTCSNVVNGVHRRGWWMPTLFPPADSKRESEEGKTGPPGELTEDDVDEFTGSSGKGMKC